MVQLATSIGGFSIGCAAMYGAVDISYWLTLALTPVTAGFLVRIFIIQHDCGHMAFFNSARLNNAVGVLCSTMTFAPYASWSRQHAGHHAVWNNLDRRVSGLDIYSSCLTIAEYRALRPAKRVQYRLSRHPLIANVLLPPLIFAILYRLPFDMPSSWRHERRAVHLTNLVLIAMFATLGLALGFGRVAAVHLPILAASSIIGVWLFSVQHRGERVRWLHHSEWTPAVAALESSTYLRLPVVLQWFTGNIGFHHIHHLNPRVPNYRLQECHVSISALAGIRTISLWEGFRSLSLVLWDEAGGCLVPVAAADRRPAS
ncbi:MAG: fatty acid desaturase family protein [Gemmatimonas sp.]